MTAAAATRIAAVAAPATDGAALVELLDVIKGGAAAADTHKGVTTRSRRTKAAAGIEAEEPIVVAAVDDDSDASTDTEQEHLLGGRSSSSSDRLQQEQPEPAAASPRAFDQLCNGGWALRWDNWKVKLYRWTILCIKQVYLIFMTLSLPTNYLMLTFRTLPRDFDEPNSCDDHLAARFRDALMPARGKLHREKSPLIKTNRAFLELPFLGIPGIVRFIDVRTQLFDDEVRAAIADGITQVVIIAAGYDTRAYRLAAPGVRFYEVDMPHASEKKQELVRELLPAKEGFSRPEFVGADLSKVKLADALSTTSFDPTRRALFIAEGLVYYLPPAAVQQLFTCIAEGSVPGSRLMIDFLNLSTLDGRKWHPGFETMMVSVWNKGEVMRSGIEEDPAAVGELLQGFGFQTREVLTAKDLVGRYMPHAEWRDKPPTVAPYFGYLSAQKL